HLLASLSVAIERAAGQPVSNSVCILKFRLIAVNIETGFAPTGNVSAGMASDKILSRLACAYALPSVPSKSSSGSPLGSEGKLNIGWRCNIESGISFMMDGGRGVPNASVQ